MGEGPLPPRTAVEVVGEVAGALHAAQVAGGPDGRPLERAVAMHEADGGDAPALAESRAALERAKKGDDR